VEGACIRAHGEGSAVIERKHLFTEPADAPREPNEPETFHGATRRFQEGLVREALEAEQDNVSASARRLGITRAHLYNLMATFGIRRDRSRRSEG
jgi:DNA-binding NtrC family response regulator